MGRGGNSTFCASPAQPEDVAGRELRNLIYGFNTLNKGGSTGIYVTELLNPESARNNDPILYLPKAKEICGVLEKDTFQVVCCEETPLDENILGGKLVLAIKNTKASKPFYKARFVVQGHTDDEKYMFIQSANIMQQHLVRI